MGKITKNKFKRTGICQITKKEYLLNELMHGFSVHESVAKLIREKYPDWNPEGYICINELNKFRHEYIKNILESEKGELTDLENEVIESLQKAELLSKDIEEEISGKLSFGEKIADTVSKFGGSWVFISAFFVFLGIWIIVNAYVLMRKPFDPYPFILLNLLLSCLAAIQAPVILMSQNRLEAKDRLRSQYDYQVNLKAELEIRHLHEKIDHLLIHQGQRLFEIQQIQIELMEEILNLISNKGKK